MIHGGRGIGNMTGGSGPGMIPGGAAGMARAIILTDRGVLTIPVPGAPDGIALTAPTAPMAPFIQEVQAGLTAETIHTAQDTRHSHPHPAWCVPVPEKPTGVTEPAVSPVAPEAPVPTIAVAPHVLQADIPAVRESPARGTAPIA